MSDQVKEIQPVNIPTALTVKAFFDKENFRKNYHSFAIQIVDSTINSLPLAYLQKELNIVEKNIDLQTLIEILKSPDLQSVVHLNEQNHTVCPTWKRLRNILYITNVENEFVEEVKKLIQTVSESHGIEYNVEVQNESIKVMVTSAHKEEEHTQLLFSLLFMKLVKSQEKSMILNCAIEDEQFSPVTSSSIPFRGPFPCQSAYNAFQSPQYQYYMLAAHPHLFQQVFQNQMQQNLGVKGGRHFKGQHPNSFNSANQTKQNNPYHINARYAGNNLQQPASHGNQVYKNLKVPNKNRSNQTTTKGRAGTKSQRIFNANDGDFPSLQ